MPLSAGQRLGPYQISAFLGAGGMGEVYGAVDTRLDRSVAIKTLRAGPNARADQRERFRLEGRAISSLSHPHICSLYDVGEYDGVAYLVMERLQGETLGKRLKRGALEVHEAVAIAIQVGEALGHAHERGLLHRDLKPENIMLTGQKRTTVKLLDFGLAKLLPEAAAIAAAGGAGNSMETVPLTGEGVIVGTFQYMAPEQLEGKEATVRTDIFAFGTVIYEMITGRKAFQGSSRASLIASILKDQPRPIAVEGATSSPALEWIIGKCLAKDPDERWHSARDLADALKWLAVSNAAPETGRRTGLQRWISKWSLSAAAIVAGAVSTAAFIANRAQPVAPAAQSRFEVRLPDDATLGEFDFPVLSPDGEHIVFPARTATGTRLFIRKLDSLEIRLLAGTDGASFPFWSPDSKWVGFFANGKLKKADITGEELFTLADASGGIGGTWSRGGVIVFCPKLDSALERVNASGGTAVPATRLDAAHHQTSQLFPEFLPDGRHFVMYGVSAGREYDFNAAYLGSIDSLEVKPLFPTTGRVMFAEPGYLVFSRFDRLLAQPFSLSRLQPTGQPALVMEGAGNLGAVLGSAFSVSNSLLAYRAGAHAMPVLTWINRKGTKLGTVADPGDYGDQALSPDGKMLAADFRASGEQPRAMWLFDLVRGNKSRLTFDSADEFNPTWSPDGKRLAFTSPRHGIRDLYEKPADGSGPERAIYESAQEKNLEDWSPDGNYLLFNTRVAGQPIEIWALPLSGDRKPFRVAGGQGNCEQGKFSPDGRWVAYRSYETGKAEIFVQQFPPAGGKWQISPSEGSDPQWNRDGKEIFYVDGSRLMAAEVRTSARQFEAGIPHALFEVRLARSGRNSYSVSPDGQRFLMNVAPSEKSATGFVVVTNWMQRLSP